MQPSGKWIEGVPADGAVEDAARLSLEPRLAKVARCLPLAAYLAAHDIEHVHRLRVATRRAVATVKLYRDLIPRKQFRWFKKQLRKIRRAAGDARDLDVLIERLAGEYGDRIVPVLTLIGERRADVQPDIVRVAERCGRDDRFVQKTAKLLSSVRAPAGTDEAAKSHRFRDWGSKRLAGMIEQFIAAMPDDQSDAAALHRFRIAAKALRYTIELVAPTFAPTLREEVYPEIEELQERLGKVQDHVTARDHLRPWAEQAKDDAVRNSLGELIESEDRRLHEEIAEFRQWWTDDRAVQLRERLQLAVQESPPTSVPQVAHQM